MSNKSKKASTAFIVSIILFLLSIGPLFLATNMDYMELMVTKLFGILFLIYGILFLVKGFKRLSANKSN